MSTGRGRFRMHARISFMASINRDRRRKAGRVTNIPLLTRAVLVAILTAFCDSAFAAIPASERQALVDLYNSTNGANWQFKTNWLGPVGTECSWFGIGCDEAQTHVVRISSSNDYAGTLPSSLANLTSLKTIRMSGHLVGIPPWLGQITSLTELNLSGCNLGGSIPAELGNLSNLTFLYLQSNQLSGTIPPQLGDLTALNYLYLEQNQLTGNIPPQLGNLTHLKELGLGLNKLSGTIPAQFGSLTDLNDLDLFANQLTGPIPSELTNLTNLSVPGLAIDRNALYSTNASLSAFLSSKEPNWQANQTIAPTNLTVSPAASTITINWTPITYTGDSGFYQVLYSMTSRGPYTPFSETTNSKSSSSLTVTGLAANTTYHFVVRTTTQPNGNNSNTVTSDFSAEVSGKTASVQPRPTADFTFAPTSPLAKQQVTFSDTSTGSPTSWSWQFGDGASSTNQNPTHTFDSAGNYSVSLAVSSAGGSNSATRSITVSAATVALKADFSINPSVPAVGQEVTYLDASAGSPTSWSWDFGDGKTSTDQNPTHIYLVDGSYDVTLTIRNASLTDSTRKTVFVTGTCPIKQPILPADPAAQEMERLALGRTLGNCSAAGFTLVPDYVNGALDAAVTSLKLSLPSEITISRISGYRSKAYQQHLYDVKTAHDDLYRLRITNPSAASGCGSLDTWITAEIDKHCLTPHTNDPYLAVSQPASSAHTVQRDEGGARALDLQITPASKASTVTTKLACCGLSRCQSDSAFHVQLSSDGNCRLPQSVLATARSSAAANGAVTNAALGAAVRMLVTDSKGRRVGYDPISDKVLNEFPAGVAEYIGDDMTNTQIVIADQGDSEYTLTAVGVTSGTYELVLQSIDTEHGDVVQQQVIRGTAAAGIAIAPATIVIHEVSQPIQPSTGRRRTVLH